MNRSRYESTVANLSSSARKVLDSIPLAEDWTRQQVNAELRRKGINMELARVEGCIESLIESGLVQAAGGLLRQIRPEEAPAKSPARQKVEAKAVPAERKRDPLAELAEIAADLRAKGSAMIEMADQIEYVALDVTAQIQTAGEAGQKLAQLQSLLRGLATEGAGC